MELYFVPAALWALPPDIKHSESSPSSDRMARVCLLVFATCFLLETYGLDAVVVDEQTGEPLRELHTTMKIKLS